MYTQLIGMKWYYNTVCNKSFEWENFYSFHNFYSTVYLFPQIIFKATLWSMALSVWWYEYIQACHCKIFAMYGILIFTTAIVIVNISILQYIAMLNVVGIDCKNYWASANLDYIYSSFLAFSYSCILTIKTHIPMCNVFSPKSTHLFQYTTLKHDTQCGIDPHP